MAGRPPKSTKDKTKKSTTKETVIKKEFSCTCCGETKKESEFYSSQSEIFKANSKMCVCKDCLINTVFEHYKEKYKGDEEASLYRTCELLDIYYTEILIESSRKELEKCGTDKSNVMKYYMKNIAMPQYKGMTFEDREIKHIHAKEILYENELSLKSLSIEDQKSKDDCLRMLGYDPFKGYELNDQKTIYNDLIPYLDEDTLDDTFKISVILQIVNNNAQIRKANLAINGLSSGMDSMVKNSKDILSLTDMTTKWNQQNDKLSKENNIALKHRGGANSKNSTLGSMMKNLRELGFEKAEHDYYDMKKAYGMKFSADISNKSIMDIINFDDTKINDIIKTQRDSLQKAQEKELDYREDIRKLVSENSNFKKQIKEFENKNDK
jgi:hypothetical protein